MAGDARLLKASLRGDHDAFARIVRRYQSLVCAITYSGTGDLAASEDLAQETFLTAWQRLASLREPSRLRSWLCTIARNRTTDYLRRRQHDVAAEAMPVEDAPAVESALPSPADDAASRERERLVWDALSEMPDTYRLPLVLYYREDQSVRKVARALDLSSSAVKLRLMRGRGMLRDKMAALVEDTLSTTAPGGTFAAAVLAGVAGATVKKGAGSTILGLSLAKATVVGVLVAGLATGALIAMGTRATAPGPPPALPPASRLGGGGRPRQPAPNTAAKTDLRAVMARIKAREERVQSVECAWVTGRTVGPWSYTTIVEDPAPRLGDTGPAKETVVDDSHTLVIDGLRAAHNARQSQWSGVAGEFHPLETAAAFTEGEGRMLHKSPVLFEPQAVVGTAAVAFLSVDIAPVLYAYRLSDPFLGIGMPEGLEVAGREDHDGHPCVLLAWPVGEDPGVRHTLWLAEDQDYCPVRYESASWRLVQHTMRYERREAGIWALTSWESQVSRRGRPQWSTASAISDLRLNEPVDPKAFEVVFPAGTLVQDAFLDIQYTVAEGTVHDGEMLCRAARDGDLARVERLVAEGADVNLPCPGGKVPLHFAAETGRAEVIGFLLARGADPSVRDDAGHTPLHLAAWKGKRVAVEELLLAAGADVNATDLRGRTPTGLGILAGNDDIVELLRQHGGVE